MQRNSISSSPMGDRESDVFGPPNTVESPPLSRDIRQQGGVSLVVNPNETQPFTPRASSDSDFPSDLISTPNALEIWHFFQNPVLTAGEKQSEGLYGAQCACSPQDHIALARQHKALVVRLSDEKKRNLQNHLKHCQSVLSQEENLQNISAVLPAHTESEQVLRRSEYSDDGIPQSAFKRRGNAASRLKQKISNAEDDELPSKHGYSSSYDVADSYEDSYDEEEDNERIKREADEQTDANQRKYQQQLKRKKVSDIAAPMGSSSRELSDEDNSASTTTTTTTTTTTSSTYNPSNLFKQDLIQALQAFSLGDTVPPKNTSIPDKLKQIEQERAAKKAAVIAPPRSNSVSSSLSDEKTMQHAQSLASQAGIVAIPGLIANQETILPSFPTLSDEDLAALDAEAWHRRMQQQQQDERAVAYHPSQQHAPTQFGVVVDSSQQHKPQKSSNAFSERSMQSSGMIKQSQPAINSVKPTLSIKSPLIKSKMNSSRSRDMLHSPKLQQVRRVEPAEKPALEPHQQLEFDRIVSCTSHLLDAIHSENTLRVLLWEEMKALHSKIQEEQDTLSEPSLEESIVPRANSKQQDIDRQYSARCDIISTLSLQLEQALHACGVDVANTDTEWCNVHKQELHEAIEMYVQKIWPPVPKTVDGSRYSAYLDARGQRDAERAREHEETIHLNADGQHDGLLEQSTLFTMSMKSPVKVKKELYTVREDDRQQEPQLEQSQQQQDQRDQQPSQQQPQQQPSQQQQQQQQVATPVTTDTPILEPPITVNEPVNAAMLEQMVQTSSSDLVDVPTSATTISTTTTTTVDITTNTPAINVTNIKAFTEDCPSTLSEKLASAFCPAPVEPAMPPCPDVVSLFDQVLVFGADRISWPPTFFSKAALPSDDGSATGVAPLIQLPVYADLLEAFPPNSSSGLSASTIQSHLNGLDRCFVHYDSVQATPQTPSALVAECSTLGLYVPNTHTHTVESQFATLATPFSAEPSPHAYTFTMRSGTNTRASSDGEYSDWVYAVAIPTFAVVAVDDEQQQSKAFDIKAEHNGASVKVINNNDDKQDDIIHMITPNIIAPSFALVPKTYVITSRYPFLPFLQAMLTIVVELSYRMELLQSVLRLLSTVQHDLHVLSSAFFMTTINGAKASMETVAHSLRASHPEYSASIESQPQESMFQFDLDKLSEMLGAQPTAEIVLPYQAQALVSMDVFRLPLPSKSLVTLQTPHIMAFLTCAHKTPVPSLGYAVSVQLPPVPALAEPMYRCLLDSMRVLLQVRGKTDKDKIDPDVQTSLLGLNESRAKMGLPHLSLRFSRQFYTSVFDIIVSMQYVEPCIGFEAYQAILPAAGSGPQHCFLSRVPFHGEGLSSSLLRYVNTQYNYQDSDQRDIVNLVNGKIQLTNDQVELDRLWSTYLVFVRPPASHLFQLTAQPVSKLYNSFSIEDSYAVIPGVVRTHQEAQPEFTQALLKENGLNMTSEEIEAHATRHLVRTMGHTPVQSQQQQPHAGKACVGLSDIASPFTLELLYFLGTGLFLRAFGGSAPATVRAFRDIPAAPSYLWGRVPACSVIAGLASVEALVQSFDSIPLVRFGALVSICTPMLSGHINRMLQTVYLRLRPRKSWMSIVSDDVRTNSKNSLMAVLERANTLKEQGLDSQLPPLPAEEASKAVETERAHWTVALQMFIRKGSRWNSAVVTVSSTQKAVCSLRALDAVALWTEWRTSKSILPLLREAFSPLQPLLPQSSYVQASAPFQPVKAVSVFTSEALTLQQAVVCSYNHCTSDAALTTDSMTMLQRVAVTAGQQFFSYPSMINATMPNCPSVLGQPHADSISAATLTDLQEYVLLEYKVIVYDPDPAAASAGVQSLLPLISPLQCTSTVIPLLPRNLREREGAFTTILANHPNNYYLLKQRAWKLYTDTIPSSAVSMPIDVDSDTLGLPHASAEFQDSTFVFTSDTAISREDLLAPFECSVFTDILDSPVPYIVGTTELPRRFYKNEIPDLGGLDMTMLALDTVVWVPRAGHALLVNPKSFAAVRTRNGRKEVKEQSPEDVVSEYQPIDLLSANSVIDAAMAGQGPVKHGKGLLSPEIPFKKTLVGLQQPLLAQLPSSNPRGFARRYISAFKEVTVASAQLGGSDQGSPACIVAGERLGTQSQQHPFYRSVQPVVVDNATGRTGYSIPAAASKIATLGLDGKPLVKLENPDCRVSSHTAMLRYLPFHAAEDAVEEMKLAAEALTLQCAHMGQKEATSVVLRPSMQRVPQDTVLNYSSSRASGQLHFHAFWDSGLYATTAAITAVNQALSFINQFNLSIITLLAHRTVAKAQALHELAGKMLSSDISGPLKPVPRQSNESRPVVSSKAAKSAGPSFEPIKCEAMGTETDMEISTFISEFNLDAVKLSGLHNNLDKTDPQHMSEQQLRQIQFQLQSIDQQKVQDALNLLPVQRVLYHGSNVLLPLVARVTALHNPNISSEEVDEYISKHADQPTSSSSLKKSSFFSKLFSRNTGDSEPSSTAPNVRALERGTLLDYTELAGGSFASVEQMFPIFSQVHKLTPQEMLFVCQVERTQLVDMLYQSSAARSNAHCGFSKYTPYIHSVLTQGSIHTALLQCMHRYVNAKFKTFETRKYKTIKDEQLAVEKVRDTLCRFIYGFNTAQLFHKLSQFPYTTMNPRGVQLEQMRAIWRANKTKTELEVVNRDFMYLKKIKSTPGMYQSLLQNRRPLNKGMLPVLELSKAVVSREPTFFDANGVLGKHKYRNASEEGNNMYSGGSANSQYQMNMSNSQHMMNMNNSQQYMNQTIVHGNPNMMTMNNPQQHMMTGGLQMMSNNNPQMISSNNSQMMSSNAQMMSSNHQMMNTSIGMNNNSNMMFPNNMNSNSMNNNVVLNNRTMNNMPSNITMNNNNLVTNNNPNVMMSNNSFNVNHASITHQPSLNQQNSQYNYQNMLSSQHSNVMNLNMQAPSPMHNSSSNMNRSVVTQNDTMMMANVYQPTIFTIPNNQHENTFYNSQNIPSQQSMLNNPTIVHNPLYSEQSQMHPSQASVQVTGLSEQQPRPFYNQQPSFGQHQFL